MKNVQLLILSLFIGCGFTLQAQTTNGTIQGKVFEQADSSLGVIGANVFVEHNGDKIGVSTDVNGKFKIPAVPPGTYTLQISHISFRDQQMTEIEVKPNSITFAGNIYMSDDTELPPIIVRAPNYLIDKENPTKMTKTFKELAHNPNIQNPAKLIQQFSPEIKMSEDGQQLYFRGSRSDATTYYIDGVRTQGLQPIPGTAIGSMTVYTGGVPAKYGDTTGGVVVMETKSYSQLYNNWKAIQSRKKRK